MPEGIGLKFDEWAVSGLRSEIVNSGKSEAGLTMTILLPVRGFCVSSCTILYLRPFPLMSCLPPLIVSILIICISSIARSQRVYIWYVEVVVQDGEMLYWGKQARDETRILSSLACRCSLLDNTYLWSFSCAKDIGLPFTTHSGFAMVHHLAAICHSLHASAF